MKSNSFFYMTVTCYMVLVLAASLFGCATKNENFSDDNEQTTSAVVHLPLAVVQIKNVTRQIEIPGVAAALPDHSIKISPAIVGKLVDVYVVPGQSVKQGQIIAKLDDRHIRDQLEQAKAAIELVQTNIAQGKNNLAFAKDSLERQQKLFGAEVSAKKDIVAADNQLHMAESQLIGFQSQLKSAQANYKQVETELAFTDIHSPISGTVANRYLNVGDTADLNTPIIQVVDLASVIINATLPADTTEKIKLGQSTKITCVADPNTIFSGIVVSVSPVVDTQSNSVRIQIRSINREHKLREGQTVSVVIAAGVDKGALFIPVTALVPDPDKPNLSTVYIVKDRKAKRVSVQTGIIENKQIEIVKGLNSGDVVVVDGAYGLPEGTEVEPK